MQSHQPQGEGKLAWSKPVRLELTTRSTAGGGPAAPGEYHTPGSFSCAPSS